MADYKADVLVVGDGPAGLTCALFLAKNGLSVQVAGTDTTPMHKAILHNFPGRPDTTGSDLMADLRRQAQAFGVHSHTAKVASIQPNGNGFRAEGDGMAFQARYVVLANGRDTGLAASMQAKLGADGVQVDAGCRTTVPNLYAVGWLTSGHRTQAVISAGHGAAAALDILSREKGKPFHDFDVVDKPTSKPQQPSPS